MEPSTRKPTVSYRPNHAVAQAKVYPCLCLAFLSALSVEWAKGLLTTWESQAFKSDFYNVARTKRDMSLLLLLFLQLKISVLTLASLYARRCRGYRSHRSLQAMLTATHLQAATRTTTRFNQRCAPRVV